MPPRRVKLRVIAASLGILALGFNALVAIHLAFDLGHALAPAAHEPGEGDRGFAGCLLSLVVGHHDDDADQSPSHTADHHDACAVSGAAASLAGFAPAQTVLLPAPYLGYAPTPLALPTRPPLTGPIAAYRSRAPPSV